MGKHCPGPDSLYRIFGVALIVKPAYRAVYRVCLAAVLLGVVLAEIVLLEPV